MNALEPGAGTDAAAVDLSHAELLPEVVLEGAPTTALLPLATLGGSHGEVEVGIWEMTPGTASDVETDEVFVVLSGRATIRFVSPALPPLEVGPGSVVRLAEGMQTEWTVVETLRKVYVA